MIVNLIYKRYIILFMIFNINIYLILFYYILIIQKYIYKDNFYSIHIFKIN